MLIGQHEPNALHSATPQSDATPGGFHIEPPLAYLEVVILSVAAIQPRRTRGSVALGLLRMPATEVLED